MELNTFEQEFNKVWNKADFNQKKQILLKINKLINRKESERQTIKAFFHAVKKGNVAAVKNIIQQIRNINQKDDILGNTALTHAVFINNTEMIRLLLKHDANPYTQNNKGYNSIDAAELIGNKKVIKLLSANKREIIHRRCI